jgi:DnaJ-class molecular chaperone
VDVQVKIPAGCDNGTTLRLRGNGDKGQKGGESGDLYITLGVTPSVEFQRDGADTYTECSISLCDAILGTTTEVRTIDGSEKIKVPAGTQPETKMRIKGRGIPKLNDQTRGDAYITMKVVVPRNLSSDQQKIVEDLREAMQTEPVQT